MRATFAPALGGDQLGDVIADRCSGHCDVVIEPQRDASSTAVRLGSSGAMAECVAIWVRI